MREDIIWFLQRIQECKYRKYFRPSRSYIFLGCYDVWYDKEDEINSGKIMTYRLDEARDLGLIITKSGNKEWSNKDNWQLTDLGKEYLTNNT